MKKIYAISALYAKEFQDLLVKEQDALSNFEAYSAYEADEEEDKPYQVVNGIALYSISGKMLSTGNFFTKWMGIPTYDNIADELAQIYTDESVDKVLISMSTPGGHVAGISDLSETWSKLNAEKPITVHTAGTLASGGVWLSSNSTAIYASEVAEVGSVGVIMEHVSYEEQLKKNGITVTQVKSSDKKGVGSPAKDLSAEDLEYLQAKVEEKNELFKKQLYSTRPGIQPEALTGEVFSAAKAFGYGLIDGVKTYSQVFEQLSASANSGNNPNPYEEDLTMKRKVTAMMAEAAIEAGANPDTLEIVSQEEYDAYVASQEEQEESHQEENLESSEEETNLESSEEGETQEPTASEVLAGVQEELEAAGIQIADLTAQVASLNEDLSAFKTDDLRVVAEERVSVMRVALGMTKVDMSEFSANSLMAEYKALDKQFKKTFQTGGIVTQALEEESPKKSNITNIQNARFRSVGI